MKSLFLNRVYRKFDMSFKNKKFKKIQLKRFSFLNVSLFGIATLKIRARDDYGEDHVSRKRLRLVFAPIVALPGNNFILKPTHHFFILGFPALHNILNPVKDTIRIKLLN